MSHRGMETSCGDHEGNGRVGVSSMKISVHLTSEFGLFSQSFAAPSYWPALQTQAGYSLSTVPRGSLEVNFLVVPDLWFIDVHESKKSFLEWSGGRMGIPFIQGQIANPRSNFLECPDHASTNVHSVPSPMMHRHTLYSWYRLDYVTSFDSGSQQIWFK